MNDLKEMMTVEENIETTENIEAIENVEAPENIEAIENVETADDTKKVSGKIGYDSSYYQWEMANAIESGNQVAYEYAKRDYAEAKAREEAARINY